MSYDELPRELLDELLSAQLDGELELAAADHGIEPEEAERRIEATPGADERRAALATTLGMLEVDPLDELTRRRILDQVSRRESSEILPSAPVVSAADRRPRRWALVAAVAAGLVVVVGAGTVIVTSFGGDDATDVAASGDGASEPELPAPLVQIDADVADPAELRGLLSGERGGEAETDSGAAGADMAAEAPVTPAADEETAGAADDISEADDASEEAAEQASPEALSDPDAAGPTGAAGSRVTVAEVDPRDAAACVEQFAADFGVTPERLLAASYDGQPALVVTFEDQGLTSAVVYEPGSCVVLVTQSIR